MTLPRRLSPPWAVGFTALLAVFPLTSPAADWDTAQFQQYGGTYSADCQNPAAVRLAITANTLVAERAGRRIEGQKINPAYSYFGPSPPPGFQVALLTELPGGRELSFLVMRDKAGRFLNLQADPRTLADLGLRGKEDRTVYRDCDAARRSTDGAAARQQQQDQARDAKAAAAAHPLANPAFASAYRKTFGPRLGQRWLARMEGPSPETQPIQIAGQRYTVYAVCKPHDCADNNMVFLYAPEAGRGYALLFEGGRRASLLGAPPPTVANQLKRLWRTTWRSGS